MAKLISDKFIFQEDFTLVQRKITVSVKLYLPVFYFLVFTLSYIIVFVFFCLTYLLRVIPSGSINFPANGRISFFFMINILLYMYNVCVFRYMCIYILIYRSIWISVQIYKSLHIYLSIQLTSSLALMDIQIASISSQL